MASDSMLTSSAATLASQSQNGSFQDEPSPQDVGGSFSSRNNHHLNNGQTNSQYPSQHQDLPSSSSTQSHQQFAFQQRFPPRAMTNSSSGSAMTNSWNQQSMFSTSSSSPPSSNTGQNNHSNHHNTNHHGLNNGDGNKNNINDDASSNDSDAHQFDPNKPSNSFGSSSMSSLSHHNINNHNSNNSNNVLSSASSSSKPPSPSASIGVPATSASRGAVEVANANNLLGMRANPMQQVMQNYYYQLAMNGMPVNQVPNNMHVMGQNPQQAQPPQQHVHHTPHRIPGDSTGGNSIIPTPPLNNNNSALSSAIKRSSGTWIPPANPPYHGGSGSVTNTALQMQQSNSYIQTATSGPRIPAAAKIGAPLRGSMRREPHRAQFQTEEEFKRTWEKWREARNNNNLAVKKCRDKAKKRKPFAQKAPLTEHKEDILKDLRTLLSLLTRYELSPEDASKVRMIQALYRDPTPLRRITTTTTTTTTTRSAPGMTDPSAHSDSSASSTPIP